MSILIIDDNRTILQTLEILLRNHYDEIHTITHPSLAIAHIQKKQYDVVLLDMNFKAGINNGNEGLYWLKRIKEEVPELPVVLFTAYADIDLAVEGMKCGAVDFVTKPWDNEKLITCLTRASSAKSKKRKTQKIVQPAMFWGESVSMKVLRQLVDKVALTDANILITGENGTGKEMLAKEIHRLSKRSGQEIVSVDMGAIPDTLFESELFGYMKGAFTDAKADRKGKLESAHNSSLFMDEIGNMPIPQQVKLLSCIQSRQVTPVGSVKPTAIDIRLICATNADLAQSVKEGSFREDLFYRINTIHLQIPPLRDRLEDIGELAQLFIDKFTARYSLQSMSLSKEALVKLRSYSWPGNIRELEHMIEKAVIMSNSSEIA
ncbi:MAG: sigma-54-dependent transcriptional regulator, partial [Bacteroidales bacterium]